MTETAKKCGNCAHWVPRERTPKGMPSVKKPGDCNAAVVLIASMAYKVSINKGAVWFADDAQPCVTYERAE